MEFKDYIIVIGMIIFGDPIKSYFLNLIGQQPNRKHELNIENIRSQKAYELQVDNYFRDISSDRISNLFKSWYDFFFNEHTIPNRTNPDKVVIELEKNVDELIAYGSGETIRRLAFLQSSNYENQRKFEKGEYTPGYYHKDDKFDKDVYKNIYLMSYIIVSLKKDFTGSKIDATDLIKIKKNDYKEHEKAFIKANEDIKKMLSLDKTS